MNHHTFLRLSSFLGAITVALGAYSAHGLKSQVPPASVEIFQTGVQYQFYHLFALLIASYLYGRYNNNKIFAAIVLFFVGILLFSGSLYLMAFSMASKNNPFSWLGPVTPIGGLCFIVGWIMLGLGITSSGKRHHRRSSAED